MNKVQEILRDLGRNRFYGTIEIKFESGKVILIRKSETFKPTVENYGDTRGSENDHQC